MIKVFYSDKMVADQGDQPWAHAIKSPSALKPKAVASALKDLNVEFVEPHPITIDDMKLVHDPSYVDGVMSLQAKNGFGTISKSVVDSLPYTNGAMYDAAKAATADCPSCALVSGFHHAGYYGWEEFGYFCTFNGLMITAAKLLKDGKSRVTIIDCDQHWGNGTDDILTKLPEFKDKILHFSFGKIFDRRHVHFMGVNPASSYLSYFLLDNKHPAGLINLLYTFKPDAILYQAGADVHVDDPYGGVLSTEQMMERDRRIFIIAKKLKIPIAWNLAGGYQVDVDGSIEKVIMLHLNTFMAAKEVYAI